MSALTCTLHIFTGSSSQTLIRSAFADETVESLIGALYLQGTIPQATPNSCIVLFRNSLVSVKQTLGQTFGNLPEAERSLTILVLPVQARGALLQLWNEMLETRFASMMYIETSVGGMTIEAEELFDDDDTELALDVDLERSQAEQPPTLLGIPVSPPIPEGPVPPVLDTPTVLTIGVEPKLSPSPPPPVRTVPPVTSPPPPRPSSTPRQTWAAPSGGEHRARRSSGGTGVLTAIKSTIREFKKGVKGLADDEEEATVASRRATVRYYDRMNPEYVFPLLVALTQNEVKQIVQRHVAQQATGPFTVKLDQLAEVEPILPGCTCHPAKQTLKLSEKDATLNFWVVPHVMGKVKGAIVAIRQEGETIAAVPLNIKVTKRTAAIAMGITSLVMPFLSSMAKRFGIDFEKEGNFDVYLSILNTIFKQIPAMALLGGGAILTLLLWWMTRPRKRDMFWDVETK